MKYQTAIVCKKNIPSDFENGYRIQTDLDKWKYWKHYKQNDISWQKISLDSYKMFIFPEYMRDKQDFVN